MANRLHFLTALTLLFGFDGGAVPTFAPNARMQSFLSNMSLSFITTILEESFMIRYAPFWLKLETYNFIF